MKNYIGICTLALTGFACYALLAVHNTVAAVPGEIQATRTALVAQAVSIRIETLAEIDRQAVGIRKDATTQLNGIRLEAADSLERIRQTADSQLTGARADLKQSLEKATAPLEGLRADLQPVLANTAALTANAAALTKDAQDSLDDLYPDVRALVESADVATTQTAQTMETVRAAAPKLAEDVGGIASDFHDATHSLDTKYFHPPPMTRKQKVAAFFSNFEALAIAALRGGVL